MIHRWLQTYPGYTLTALLADDARAVFRHDALLLDPDTGKAD